MFGQVGAVHLYLELRQALDLARAHLGAGGQGAQTAASIGRQTSSGWITAAARAPRARFTTTAWMPPAASVATVWKLGRECGLGRPSWRLDAAAHRQGALDGMVAREWWVGSADIKEKGLEMRSGPGRTACAFSTGA
ncbi:hypothetical protein AB0K15_47900 [Amycolatopsis sp. NPDC049253]|uniref:hypothetical protein n=1 Tax=Amycolatopsis sp. NPDC049253 TaxID=3155274 RepID=UPI00343B97EC